MHPFTAFRSKLCKVLDKLVRQPLTAVRSASVPRAPAAKAEIAVDSRILLHTPHRPEAVRKIDIRIRWKSMITGFILIYFDFPQFSDDLTPDCVQQLIGMHLLVANIAVIAAVAVVAVIAVGTEDQGGNATVQTPLRRNCQIVARCCSVFSVLRRTARRTARRVQAQTPLVQHHCGLTADCFEFHVNWFEFDVILQMHTPRLKRIPKPR